MSADDFSPPGAEATVGDLSDPAVRATLPKNDLGNARRLKAASGDMLRWINGIGWAVFDGRRWVAEHGEGPARMLAQRLPDLITEEAAAYAKAEIPAWELEAEMRATGKDKADAEAARKAIRARRKATHRKWAVACGGSARITSALGELRPMVAVDIREFDRRGWRLTLQNGVLDLRAAAAPALEGETEDERWAWLSREFEPEDRATKIGDVAFDPEAVAPRWKRQMETLFPDPETRAYAQRCAGYLLVGDNWLQTFVLLKGQGGNGKSSVFMAGVRRVLGEMVAVVPETTFIDTGKAGDGPTPIEAQWPGKRVYFADEIAKGKRLNAAMINAITGGLERTSHAKGQAPFTWKPDGTPVICVNKLPPLGDDSNAMLRRAQIVPFMVNLREIPAEQRMTEQEVRDAIREEGAGILNWMLDGLRDVSARGFAPPRQAQDQLDALRADADPVSEFLHACMMRTGGGRVKNKALATGFNGWAEAAGVRDMTASTLSRAMTNKDFTAIRSDGKTWINIDWIDARTALDRGFAETMAEADDYVRQVRRWVDDIGTDGMPR